MIVRNIALAVTLTVIGIWSSTGGELLPNGDNECAESFLKYTDENFTVLIKNQSYYLFAFSSMHSLDPSSIVSGADRVNTASNYTHRSLMLDLLRYVSSHNYCRWGVFGENSATRPLVLLRRKRDNEVAIYSAPFAKNCENQSNVGFATCAAAWVNDQLDQAYGEWQEWDGLRPYPNIRWPIIGGLSSMSAAAVLAGGWYFHKWMKSDSTKDKSFAISGLVASTAIGAASSFFNYKFTRII
ncbi:MAG: hypothetical protein LBJ92_02400 [Holosporales bacterium]|jgi:hypothetical protein|nr:hypothetical protein [Holosporales bacterium]